MLATKQQLLLDDVESLRTRLKDLGDEAAALRKEVDAPHRHLTAPHAVQQRMAQMLRRAVGDVAEMHAEAQAEAAALVAAGSRPKSEADAAKTERAIGGPWQQSEIAGNRLCGSQGKARAELDRLSAETHRRSLTRGRTLRKREQLLADAKLAADHYREQARQAIEEAMQQRIKVLEQLMGVYRDLEGVPATLESAYQELKNPADSAGQASPQKACPGRVRYSRRRVDPARQAHRRASAADSRCSPRI